MIWNFNENGEAFLREAAEEADRQKLMLQLKTCKVREELPNKRANLTNEEANAYNQKVLDIVKGIGNFIRTYLIGGLLTNDDERLQQHEKLLGVMLCPGDVNNTTINAWRAKISKMFMDGYDDGVFTISLQQIYESLCIKNPIHPSDNRPLELTGSQAYLLKLTISHSHHLTGSNTIFYDCNPLHFEFDNQADNNSKKSCSRFPWFRICQCTHQCHPRLELLLDKERFENEIKTQLLMIGGFFPADDEIGIREKIRDLFIMHFQRNSNQALPEYLLDENKPQLLEPQYSHFEKLRPRFDLNADGDGIYCTRQQCKLTLNQILRGEKNVPKGLLGFLDVALRELTPAVAPRVKKLEDDDQYDRSVPGQRWSQADAIDENLLQFQRVLAMGIALRHVIEGRFTYNHEGMSMGEHSVNSLLYDGVLDEDQQMVTFDITSRGLRNDYLENKRKTKFGVHIARLMKTLEIYFDHHDKWLELDDGGTEFANPQVFLNFTSISNPPRTVLTPQQAHCQVVQASHTTHPEAIRYTDPITPQEGGFARDANPDNTVQEPEEINLHRGICSVRPVIPCMNMCQCHPKYKCAPVLHKLNERYINDTALVQWQLGDNGRFPRMSIKDIRKALIVEVREAYKCQGVPAPDFIKVAEHFLQKGIVFPEYDCVNCEAKVHHTLAEVDACGKQKPAADQDNRVEVNYDDIKGNDDYLVEILGLMKEWGWGNWTNIWKRTTSFKVHDDARDSLLRQKTNSSPIKKYCGRNQIDFELLTKCSGIKYGCPCELHDEEDSDE